VFRWLFDVSQFTARSRCGPGWSDGLIYINLLANLVIAMAYFYIPTMLLWLYFRVKRDAKFAVIKEQAWILVLFALFIFACGLTHICSAAAFFRPAYRFFTVVDSVTALLSGPTAYLLPAVVIKIIMIGPKANVKRKP
jgi:hypothetical protein